MTRLRPTNVPVFTEIHFVYGGWSLGRGCVRYLRMPNGRIMTATPSGNAITAIEVRRWRGDHVWNQDDDWWHFGSECPHVKR